MIVSDTPCRTSRKKPIGIRILTGQRNSPPASLEYSLRSIDSTTIGQDSTMMISAIGSKKKTLPNRSIQARIRGDRWP